jgi:hypothetical protein
MTEEEVHARRLVPYNTRDLASQVGFFPKGSKQEQETLQQELFQQIKQVTRDPRLFACRVWRYCFHFV